MHLGSMFRPCHKECSVLQSWTYLVVLNYNAGFVHGRTQDFAFQSHEGPFIKSILPPTCSHKDVSGFSQTKDDVMMTPPQLELDMGTHSSEDDLGRPETTLGEGQEVLFSRPQAFSTEHLDLIAAVEGSAPESLAPGWAGDMPDSGKTQGTPCLVRPDLGLPVPQVLLLPGRSDRIVCSWGGNTLLKKWQDGSLCSSCQSKSLPKCIKCFAGLRLNQVLARGSPGTGGASCFPGYLSPELNKESWWFTQFVWLVYFCTTCEPGPKTQLLTITLISLLFRLDLVTSCWMNPCFWGILWLALSPPAEQAREFKKDKQTMYTSSHNLILWRYVS